MDLDRKLDDLSELASQLPDADVYFRALVNSLVSTSPEILAAAAWTLEQGRFRLQAEENLQHYGIASDADVRTLHEKALEEATAPNAPPLQCESPDGKSLFLFATGSFDGDSFLVLELICPKTDDATVENYFRLLEAFNETAREYRSRILIQHLRDRDELWTQLNRRLAVWYGADSLVKTAYVIANDLAEFANVDRVSVATYSHRKSKVQAVSGLVAFDRRAKQVVKLEDLMSVAAHAQLQIDAPASKELPPICVDSLDAYVDVSGSQSMVIKPLIYRSEAKSPASAPTAFAVLALESFRDTSPIPLEPIQDAIRHAELALSQASDRQKSLSLRFGRTLDRIQNRLSLSKFASLAIAMVLALILLGLFAIPIRHEVWGEGTLEFAASRDVFAPIDAEIAELRITHGKLVAQGDTLMTLRSRAMELKREELTTEREVAIEKLRSMEASRLSDRRNRPNENTPATDWAAAEKELRELVDGHEKQLRVVNEILSTLILQSPTSGQVVSWNDSNEWLRRPVRQGQRLATVVDLNSPARLRLAVRDEDALVLQRRIQNNSEPVDVRFTLVSNPEISLQATLARVGLNTDRSESAPGTFRVEADVKPEQAVAPNPGASVRGRIDCGTTSLGFLWWNRLITQWRLWWYF